MAVQKSKVSRSKRGMRRANNKAPVPALGTHPLTGETYRLHHVTRAGYYKERQIKVLKKEITDEIEE